MADFYEILFGRNAQSVRRNVQARITVDEHGNPVVVPTAGDTISLSDDGAIDHFVLAPESFYHCGHSARYPVGGHCAEPGCRQVSCERCFQISRCESCDKPLCLEHTLRLEDKERQVGRFCRRCHNELSRKRFAKALVYGFFRPFHEELKRTKR